MASGFGNHLESFKKPLIERRPGRYQLKLLHLKRLIKDYVHENGALVDEVKELQIETIIRKEERKFLLRKLCEYEYHTAMEVQNVAKLVGKGNSTSTTSTPVLNDHKKSRKRFHPDLPERKSSKSRKSSKMRKKVVQPIPLDSFGRPIFPIQLTTLTVHSLGDVVTDRADFHTENAIYPVGFVSTRIYGSLRDPTIKCIYTCKISDANGTPRFEIASDDNGGPIIGDTPDICHSILLQRINDALAFNAVSTRPRGNDFFGLTHPTVLNLIQSSPGTRKCINYRWSKFAVSKHGDHYVEDNDSGLSYQYLQRSINFCKYKMAPDVLQKPPDDYIDKKSNFCDNI